MFKQAGGQGEMLIIHGQKGTTPEVDRTKGCGEALAANPGIKVVGELWSEAGIRTRASSSRRTCSRRIPMSTIVWGQADALALGAAQAVKVANLGRKVWVAGFDGDVAALKALKDGVFDVTATQQTQGMGRLAVDSRHQAGRRRERPGRAAAGRDADRPRTMSSGFIAKHP